MDKLISAEAFKKIMEKSEYLDECLLDDAPEAVVRCKDCLWGKWNGALWDSIYCENIGMDRDWNDYCSRGERKKDG